eukprot:304743_1
MSPWQTFLKHTESNAHAALPSLNKWFLIFVLNTVLCMSIFPNITFDHASINEDFDGTRMDIGWIKYATCMEGRISSSKLNALKYPNHVSLEKLLNISKYAVTVKFLPSSDIPDGVNENIEYAVKAHICSNPIYALNNGYQLSWTLNITTSLIIGYANIGNWIGAVEAKN